MSLLPANYKQLPDHAILDYYNKQIYLGQQFTANYSATVTTGELPIMLLSSVTPNLALFQGLIQTCSLSATKNVVVRVYANPTISAGAQTVVMAADSSGSLNSTYFLLNAPNGDKFYVWFNINSAGVDPAVAGRIAIPVAGATNATAATLGAAMATAIGTTVAASAADFTASGTTTVTITNKAKGTFTAAVDGAAPTGFTFAVTSTSNGTVLTPVNSRPAYTNAATGIATSLPTVSANGTLLNVLSSQALVSAQSKIMTALDNGQTLLVTALASASSTTVLTVLGWYEL